jgi:ferric hydroxamate transport system permease protein
VTTLAAPRRTLPLAGVVGVGLAAAVVIALVHVTQGTADVGVRDIVALLFGGPDEQAAAVVVASRVPRLAAGVVVGVALGVAGAALQSLARNPLASPDTLGVDAGAYVALVLAAVFAVALPVPFAGGLAFVGGLAAAGLVLVLASGAGAGPTRLVLAGSAIALALDAVTVTLLLLFREHTVGLFAWGSGSLSQYGGEGLAWMTPVVLVGVVGLFALAGRLDVHGLGDDAAAALGLQPKRTRRAVVLLAVALSAASVTVAGPVGFVGLAAPAIVRLLGPPCRGCCGTARSCPCRRCPGWSWCSGPTWWCAGRWAHRWAASRCRRAWSPRWWARCSWCCSPPGSAAQDRCGPPRRRCAGGGWPWW